MAEEIKIYPDLQDTDTFRLHKINEIQKEIISEHEKRNSLYKKYNKIINSINTLETSAEFGGIAIGSVGIAAITGVVTSPIGFVLEH